MGQTTTEASRLGGVSGAEGTGLAGEAEGTQWRRRR